MISIDHAIRTIKKHTHVLAQETIKPIEKANGYILSQTVYAPIDMPPFRQSAMDGYALHLHDALSYTIIGEVQAGDPKGYSLKKGEAVRIFTGAPVPDSANAVIMQERVKVTRLKIEIEGDVNEGDNVRPLGEQIKAGEIALQKGAQLNPAGIGYLLSLGIGHVSVYKKPTIAIVSTGNELVEPGTELVHGKIYESNSKMLLSALYSLKFYDVIIHRIKDDFAETRKSLKQLISNNDMVIITGGISVGDYDFVGRALNELQVETLFYKVNQKPGKPLFYGKKEHTSIFALPGNPAAALTCFYLYVYIALSGMMNYTNDELPRIKSKSLSEFEKKADRPQFLKARYKNGEVEILDGQNSSMLQSFALANALVFMPEDLKIIKVGDSVETIVLPV